MLPAIGVGLSSCHQCLSLWHGAAGKAQGPAAGKDTLAAGKDVAKTAPASPRPSGTLITASHPGVARVHPSLPL
jgi:hypothetical protein